MARILVAEDESAVAEFIRRALTGAGHQVAVVGDGAAAWRRALAEDFDLLLSDVRMPVMDGVALALALGADRPALPILLMTGFTSERERADDLAGFVSGVLQKPFSMADLLDAVAAALSA